METAEFQSRLHDLFAEAIGLPSAERTAFLDGSCSDPALRAAVDDLLAAHQSAGGFLSDPVIPRDQLPTSDEPVRIGPYTLRGIIGEGGHGTVYLAGQDPPLARTVAVKVIRAGMDTAATVARFEIERQSLARMDHPNIARVYDAGTTPGGQPYFVMELVDGPAVTDHCVTAKLDLPARLNLLRDVCAAVQHAHQKRIVHRDLKPTNILVAVHDGKPVPKVIDFGIAIAIGGESGPHSGSNGSAARLLGTPSYSSPEQLSLGPDDVDTRADIYGLGMILYELLTDAPAFDGAALRAAADREVARTIREVDPPVPSRRGAGASLGIRARIGPDLDRVVMKAIEKDRSRRYATVEAFSADLLRYLRHEPVEAGPSTAVHRAGLYMRRHGRLVSTISLLMAVLIAGTAVALVGLVKARTERDRAVAAESRADQARHQADADRDRAVAAELTANQARQRADTERDRADTARKRADDNATRVYSAQQFVYHLVTDPDRPISPTVLDELAKRANDPLLTAHPDVVETLHLALATAYLRARLYEPAVTQYRAYMDGSPPEATADDLIMEASVLHNMGYSMLCQGDYAGSRLVFRRSLDVFYRATNGKDDTRDIPTLEHLGLTTAHGGDLKTGERFLRRAVEMLVKTEQPGEHKEWAAQEELAQVLDEQGRHDEAKVLWDAAMPYDSHKRSPDTHRIVNKQ